MAQTLTVNGVAATGYNLPDHKRATTFSGLAFEISINASTDIIGAKIEMNVEGTIFSTVTGEIAITDGAGGKFQIIEQVIDLPARLYNYEILITFVSGKIKQYIQGTWNITE